MIQLIAGNVDQALTMVVQWARHLTLPKSSHTPKVPPTGYSNGHGQMPSPSPQDTYTVVEQTTQQPQIFSRRQKAYLKLV